ncbi:MAG: hypothetical protein FJX52_05870 [Alphaproteobacteria bacterium]|nr:hypothetical protein [Alphaproteobacteria bacterium]
MIVEALTYLTTPCPRHVRRLGYLGELIGIAARLRRCRAAWSGHLDNSRSTIEAAIARTERRRRAVVLGSGILADVPVAALAAAFDETVLVDLVHLAATRRQLRRHGKVRLVEADVTGTLAALWRYSGQGRLPASHPTLGVDGDADLVVSCNLLSQLPIMPITWLDRCRRRGATLSADDIVAFGRSLIASHLEFLIGQPGKVAIISDIERLTYAADAPDQAPVEREDALLGVPFPYAGTTWTWRIAPNPEFSANHHRYHRVMGIADLAAAVAATPT